MRALILVDIQHDFLPGGALGVPNGDAVIPVANSLSARFDVVVATQDWHPADHGSFAVHHPGHQPGEVIDLNGLPQVLWPVHCVAESHGAAFHPDVDMARVSAVFRKGTDPRVDSYSGFFDNGRRNDTGLDAWLRARGVDEVVVMGLATDYCVKWTALDAQSLGYRTTLVVDGSRGVELAPGDVERAIEAMRTAGIRIARAEEV
jgi:nicotinamidase/pyrazinamidase